MNWQSYTSNVFDIGQYRRDTYGKGLQRNFFNDQESVRKCTELALTDVFEFFGDGGQVAIFDANNHTEALREHVRGYVNREQAAHKDKLDVSLVWIEVMVEGEEAVDQNIKEMFKTSPDYVGKEIDESEATSEFRNVIETCNQVYEPLSTERNLDDSYIQVFGSPVVRVLMNHIHGYLMGKIVFFIMSFRTLKHEIYISRHGESEFNTQGKLGGDSGLSARGKQYAKALGEFINSSQAEMHNHSEAPLTVWCSTLERTKETASYVRDLDDVVQWRSLEEIDAGICDGLTVDEVKEKYPDIHAARTADKLRYRYPNGESYQDVIARLEQVILELNRLKGPVLVVGHRAVLRCLYAYFLDIPSEKIPHLSVPLHTIIKLTPKAYGCHEERLQFGISSVDDAVSDETGIMKERQSIPMPVGITHTTTTHTTTTNGRAGKGGT